MRVTQNSSFNLVKDTVHQSRSRMEDLQEKAVTMKKLNRPSDNPINAAKVLEMRSEKVKNEQFLDNARLAENYLRSSESVISELSDIVLRAKDIAIGQASGASSSQASRVGVAEEVAQLYQQAVGLANTRIGDRYLFGGYKTDTPPVNPNGQYEGDRGEAMVEISNGVFIGMNLPGVEVFNTNADVSGDQSRLMQREAAVAQGDPDLAQAEPIRDKNSPENVNAFSELGNLRIALLTGDLGGIRNTLDRFDEIHENLTAQRAKIGSRLQGIESAAKTMERANITNSKLNSEFEDADMASVMTDLAREESVLKSVLGTSNRLIQPTLMDFLR